MEVPTLSAFAPEWFATYVTNNNKPSEQQTKSSTLKCHIVPAFGALKLDEIGLRQIEMFKSKQLAAGLNPKSVNNHLMCLSKLLSTAVDWEIIHKAPKITRLKAPPSGFDFLTFEESARLLEHAEDCWRPMMLLALKTGLRRGELVALQRQDFDLENGRLLVRRNFVRGHIGTPKNGKHREVPLSAQTCEYFDPLLFGLASDALVFPGRNGKPMESSSTRWPLWAACKRAGINRKLGWHALRHTFASHLCMRGVPLKSVQELLGHGAITVTMRYAHLSPQVNRDSIAQLDR